jgi:hypothetical protein
MMRTRQITESETTYRTLLAAVEAGEEVALSRYGYGLLLSRLLPGFLGTRQGTYRSESHRVLDSAQGLAADIHSPLD